MPRELFSRKCMYRMSFYFENLACNPSNLILVVIYLRSISVSDFMEFENFFSMPAHFV